MRSKIFSSVEHLASSLSGKRPKILVSTNGCFDILHVGHVEYLEASRALGDALVVFVNTDRSVKEQNKADNRPINNLQDRMRVLAALECVDYVCAFDEKTPIEVLSVLKPNIHTKGGDYSAESLPETTVLKSWNARVEIIPLVKGKSTTNLIDQISKGKR